MQFYGGATLGWVEVEYDLDDLARRFLRSEYGDRSMAVLYESVRHWLAYDMDVSWHTEDDLDSVIDAILVALELDHCS